MRKVLKGIIFFLLFLVIGTGAYLSYLVADIQDMRAKQLPELEKQGKKINSMLQEYAINSGVEKAKYPSAKPANWSQKIDDAIKKTGVILKLQNSKPAKKIRETDVQSIEYSITIEAESLKKIFEVAIVLEGIDKSGAARVTRLNINPRRSEKDSYTCSFEVTVYESTGVFEEALPEEAVEEQPEEQPIEQPEKPAIEKTQPAMPDNANATTPKPNPGAIAPNVKKPPLREAPKNIPQQPGKGK